MIKIMCLDQDIGLVGSLKPSSIEFWLDGDNRIHERLKYTLDNNIWIKSLLSP